MNYDLSLIQPAFLSELKFRPDNYTSVLDSSLVGNSNSGKYYNSGVNPLITLRNVLAFMPLASEWVISAWSALATYSKGSLVTSNSKYYVSLINTNLNHAVTSTAHWLETTLESVWIKNKLYGLFETVLSKSILANKLFDHVKLYNITDNSDLIVNAGKYVGFEIRPTSSEHLKIIINRIAGQFSEDENPTLYLYNQNTLVTSFEITTIAKQFQFTDITDVSISGEGRWFLFYNQDDLTGQAYNWPLHSTKYVDILPFEVPNTTTDFVNTVNSYGINSYGLGIDFSVFADLTPFILTNAQMFAECIHLQWQYDVFEMFLMNPDVKINMNQRNIDRDQVRELLLVDLKGETKHSLVSMLDRAYKTLIKSLDFGEVALPGENDNLITYNSIG
jgi:hypothetical protein